MPVCASEAITLANHLRAIDKAIKEEFRCSASASAFWVVRLDGR